MLGRTCTLEDAEELVIPPGPDDTIQVEDSSVVGQARPNRGISIAFRPLRQPGEAFPVWLLLQVARQRLSASHDEPIEMPVPQIFHTRIEAIKIAPALLRPGNSWHP